MTMTRAAALDYINRNPEGAGWRRDKSGKGYVCPLCGNGSGSDGDGLRTNPKDKSRYPHYKCFACNAYGDVMEFIALEHGLEPGSAEAFAEAYDLYGIEVENDAGYSGSGSNEPLAWDGYISEDEPVKSEVSAAEARDLQPQEPQDEPAAQGNAEAEAAARAYIKESIAAASGGAEYIQSRGISMETAAGAYIGYDAQRRAIVIPTRSESGSSYVLRYTNPAMKIRYANAEGLSVGLFNLKALKSGAPVFVVEGGFDALSILEAGYQAIALCSTSNAGKLIEMLERAKPESLPPRLLLSMDNDKAGEAATEALSEGLQRLSIPFEAVNIAEGYKDANEALQADREGFKRGLYRALNPLAAQAVDTHKVGALLPAFKAYVQDAAANRSISTGFEELDTALGGGLYPKMYVIGAISSLGKTTFALQIGDRVAASGNDVMIFSLEMPMEDLIARSISRLTYQNARASGKLWLSKTELEITAYEKYKEYTDDERNAIATAYAQYAAYASDRLSIYTGRHTAQDIRDKVEAYIEVTGRKPLVIADYLQIIQPMPQLRRATVREQVDDVIDRLAAMRRELKVPIIVVSSFNRNSYNTVADATAFKESGAIEYTADAVISLEPNVERKANAGANGSTNKAKVDTMEALRGNEHGIRDIKLTFHKNRGNRVGSTIYFNYNAPYNFFEVNELLDAII